MQQYSVRTDHSSNSGYVQPCGACMHINTIFQNLCVWTLCTSNPKGSVRLAFDDGSGGCCCTVEVRKRSNLDGLSVCSELREGRRGRARLFYTPYFSLRWPHPSFFLRKFYLLSHVELLRTSNDCRTSIPSLGRSYDALWYVPSAPDAAATFVLVSPLQRPHLWSRLRVKP